MSSTFLDQGGASSELSNFTEIELKGVVPELRVKLQALRYLANTPIHLTSGLRPGDDGEHGEGMGVDISDNSAGAPIGSRFRHYVLKAAYSLGFSRIGTYDRHIHLGISVTRDQDVTWQGISE